MGRSTQNPTIRILILGAPGVGKNCLESRFTTMTYPPPYDPALTLNSRRFFTLSPRPLTAQAAAATRPLDTSHGPDSKETAVVSSDRPNSASSHLSALASEPHHDMHAAVGERSSLDDSTLVAPSDTCTECTREQSTYLVEVINYPSLQLSRVRAHVHAKADYDAVLLVYSVTSRLSLEAAKALHSEIPVCTRKNHHHHRRAAGHSNTTRSRTSGWFGGGDNGTGATGSGEIVVGLVGNKSDFDGEAVPMGDVGHVEYQEGLFRRRARLSTPVLRESRFYDELHLRDEQLVAAGLAFSEEHDDTHPTVPDKEVDIFGPPRAASAASHHHHHHHDNKTTARASVQSVPSARTSLPYGKGGHLPIIPARHTHPKGTSDIEAWLQTGAGVTATHAHAAADGSSSAESHVAAADVPVRQVSRAEGEALGRSLLLQVPFFETSAVTGAGVEAVFEAMVREVLREMRHETHVDSAGKSCRHRAHHRFVQAPAENRPVSHVEGPAAAVGTEAVSTGKAVEAETSGEVREVREVETVDLAEANAAAAAQGLPPPKRLKRRESMMDRMRKVFMRKQMPMVTDIAA